MRGTIRKEHPARRHILPVFLEYQTRIYSGRPLHMCAIWFCGEIIPQRINRTIVRNAKQKTLAYFRDYIIPVWPNRCISPEILANQLGEL